MTYNAQSKRFEIGTKNIERAAFLLRHAMKNIRLATNLPLDKYKQEGGLTNADHAQKNIISAAQELGIDLGAEWGNEIDLRKLE